MQRVDPLLRKQKPSTNARVKQKRHEIDIERKFQKGSSEISLRHVIFVTKQLSNDYMLPSQWLMSKS